jgi:hypothetical protein
MLEAFTGVSSPHGFGSLFPNNSLILVGSTVVCISSSDARYCQQLPAGDHNAVKREKRYAFTGLKFSEGPARPKRTIHRCVHRDLVSINWGGPAIYTMRKL